MADGGPGNVVHSSSLLDGLPVLPALHVGEDTCIKVRGHGGSLLLALRLPDRRAEVEV